jgi:uncharacterized repeat protein (TIGR03809 family)
MRVFFFEPRADSMATQVSPRVPDEIVRAWTVLAERRRDHYEELYRSGRWKLYYSETQFRIRVRQAVELCDMWRAFAAALGAGTPAADDHAREAASAMALRLADLSPPPLAMTSFRSLLAGLEPRYSSGARAF